MSITIFKESGAVQKAGLIPFSDKHSTHIFAKKKIDAVYFPQIVYEHFLNSERLVQLQTSKHFAEYKLETFADSEIFGLIPSIVGQMYRKKLHKKHLSLYKKPLIVMFVTDQESIHHVAEDVICVKTSVTRNRKRTNDISCPPYIPDAGWGGPIALEPSIGFCGCPTTHKNRLELIQAFAEQEFLSFDSFFTKMFFGHFYHAPNINHRTMQGMKDLYSEIMARNIFSLCPRGKGNYSLRFFETLRAGRIPVLLDTDMVLPLEDLIDWHDAIICKKTPRELMETITDWTENRDLRAVQIRCREIWEKYMRFSSFVEYLPRYIAALL